MFTAQIPPDVHYLWCGRRWFEFRHYLSVISVLRAVQPNKITIHYEHKPDIDKVYYHQWLDNLKHDYPWFVLIIHDYPWFVLIIHDYPWFVLIINDYPWFVLVIHDDPYYYLVLLLFSVLRYIRIIAFI